MKILLNIVYILINIVAISILLIISLFFKVFKKNNNNKDKIIFGSTPILNNKYWVDALSEIDIKSETLMKNYFSSINKNEDFNKYFDDLIPQFFRKKFLDQGLYPLFVGIYLIKNAKVVAMPFSGFVFGRYFWKIEYFLFKLNGIKVIILPYGSDFLMYSIIKDPSVQNVVLISYPEAARDEKKN